MSTFTEVNPHCLHNIRVVTETNTVIASEDICDEHGRKLWAKGQPVSPDLHDRLLSRKLRTPLELLLDVATGADAKSLSRRAAELMDKEPALATLAGKQAARVVEEISRAPVEKALKLLLTCTRDNGSQGHDHAVRVVTLGATMALRAGLPEKEVSAIITGALAHDVGELYVNPEYLSSKRPLTLQEWRHVVVHPLIGRKVVQELTTLPKDVADVVAHHHERENGTGYPLQSVRATQSRAVRVVALAESLSGILQNADNPVGRAGIALRLVQGEFSADLVDLVAPLACTRDVRAPVNFEEERAMGFTRRVYGTLQRAQALLSSLTEPHPELKRTLDRTREALVRMEVAMRSSGLACLLARDDVPEDSKHAEVYLEMEVVPREIVWRMRNLARGLSLAAVLHKSGSARYHELAEVLSA